MFRRIAPLFPAIVLLLTLFSVSISAQEAICSDAAFAATGLSSPRHISDGTRSTQSTAGENATLTITRSGGIAALYIEFAHVPSPWTLIDPATSTEIACGQNGFLHEFCDLSDTLPETVTLHFPAGTAIADVYTFSQGELPDWVQVWNPPCEQADLLLLSSHSDDEQLFFAGVLPYYAVERELNVQVAYMVQHFDSAVRPHEQLDGLWAVGIRNYPVMSEFPDLYSESKDRAQAFSRAQVVFADAGFTYDDFVNYITTCIRRFRPLVVVSHDLDGEYGHGTHVYSAAALTDALVHAADAAQHPESAAEYGVWTVEKTYLHLYPENQIIMDWDTPCPRLGGKTPFEVTQNGFACHKSQHWTWFNRWIYGSPGRAVVKATDITSYSPCQYGLYHSTVGPDVTGGDFFEHVETYAQRAARAQAEAEAEAEAARLQAEAEARAQAEAEAQEQAMAEAQRQKTLRLVLTISAACVLVLLIALVYYAKRSRKHS